MRPLLLLTPLLFLLNAAVVLADARLSVLVDVLKLDEVTGILSDEGIEQAQTLNDDMLNGQGGAGFQMQVERIYDPARMAERLRSELDRVLSGTLLEDVIAFYASDLGDKIISLENSARLAIGDPDVEEAARSRYREIRDSDDERLAAITAYVEGGDMITRNVTSAINSNYQFLRGLTEGGAIEMSEDEMLGDATADLDAQTEDTTEWLFAYLLVAYHPLSLEELQTYVAFSETDAGQALNAALFNGFGKAYEDISYALGRVVAVNMTAQDL